MHETFRTARNGPVHLSTQSFGDPQDSAVILVMGATASMLWWPDSMCHALANSGRFVVRFDHRDTGESTTGAPGHADYDVEDLADDVIAVLDGYGLDRAHVVGMSLGGLIAQLLALRDPSRVQSLTLIAAEPLGGEPVQAEGPSASFLKHFATMEDVDWNDANSARAFLRHIAVLSASSARGYDQVLTEDRIDRELARASNMHAAFNHADVACDLDRWNLRDVRVPTLVIHGAHDSIVPLANGKAIARRVNGANLHILPDAGHELHSDDLPTIASLIVAHTNNYAIG